MKVILDIGHGKENMHKGVPGLQEWEFNNDVMKRAAKLIEEQSEIEILWTQPPDSNTVSLIKRANYADTTDAEILISNHADASTNPYVKGHWGFYWGTSKKGKQLAEIWRKHANELLPNKDRGLIASKKNHWSNFHILREPKQLCLLIENAFMTNAEDKKLLQSDDFRQNAAEAIKRTVFEWHKVEPKEQKESINYKKLYEEAMKKLKEIKKIAE